MCFACSPNCPECEYVNDPERGLYVHVICPACWEMVDHAIPDEMLGRLGDAWGLYIGDYLPPKTNSYNWVWLKKNPYYPHDYPELPW